MRESAGPRGLSVCLPGRGVRGPGLEEAGWAWSGGSLLPAWPPGQRAWFLLRLVLPYVRHLKGEDDKPLPPSKPRKQYKMAKEHRGDDGATERPKKAKEEKRVDQVSSGLLVPCPSQRPVPLLTLAAGLPA